MGRAVDFGRLHEGTEAYRAVRLFLSIPVPVDLSPATEPLQKEGFRPVPAGSWHMTIRFLGDMDPEPVSAAMDGFRADAMQARFTGAGAFPSPKKARVAWLGVEADGLQGVATDVRERMEGLGQRDDKDFVAHVTLGRCKRPMDLRVAISGVELPRDPFTMDRVDLMASEPTPQGAVHTVVRSWPLG